MQNEEWFLAQLEIEPIPAKSLITWLLDQVDRESLTDIDVMAELLQAKCQKSSMPDEALAALKIRAFCHRQDHKFAAKCPELIINAIGYTPEHNAMLENCGFGGRLSLNECFRRLDVLRAIKPGSLVFNETWGFGVVQDVDYFYKKIDVDFDKKPGHQVAFSYAAQRMQVLNDEHLLAIKHRDPERMKDLLENEQAEVIRILIRSFGPLPIQNVQERLIPAVISQAQWKPFWEKARKELKKDSMFEIPRKRNEPLRILETERGFNDAWFKKLALERDMEVIISSVDDLINDKERGVLTDDWKAILADRLAFVVRGAGTRLPGLAARAVMEARECEVNSEELPTEQLLRNLIDPVRFQETVRDIPAKEIHRLLGHLFEVSQDNDVVTLLLELIPEMDMSVLNETLHMLMENGCTEQVAAIIRDLTKERQIADVEVLYWVYRHQNVLEDWNLGGLPDLARWILRMLSEEQNGEKLKTQNQLRDIFERKEWLKAVMDKMKMPEAREFMRRVKNSAAWDSITRRSIMANLIKLKPELEDVIAEDRRERSVTSRVTSRRMYHIRQEQLEKISTIEIPAVSKEIGVAREHGDLRENFEYKAAKDKQALLLRRQGELEEMLNHVSPTDFSEVTADSVTQGSGVQLQFSDGKLEHYYVLGEWDRDEELGIISSESRLAQVLMGHVQGDEVTVPTGEGKEDACIITAVEPLSDAVRAWIEG